LLHYDFGDEWEHHLTLEKIESKDIAAPGGSMGRDLSPENVGGMHGLSGNVGSTSKSAASGRAATSNGWAWYPVKKWMRTFAV